MGLVGYTFDEFVEYGKGVATSSVNGIPWAFNFHGFQVTHENDDCYLIGKHDVPFHRGDMILFDGDATLIIGRKV